MKTNIKLNKAKTYMLRQEKLRNKAMLKGVNLLAPETIFLSTDINFGKNVTVEPYVVFGPKVKIGNNVVIKSFSYIEGAKIEGKQTRAAVVVKKIVAIKKFSSVGKKAETTVIAIVQALGLMN